MKLNELKWANGAHRRTIAYTHWQQPGNKSVCVCVWSSVANVYWILCIVANLCGSQWKGSKREARLWVNCTPLAPHSIYYFILCTYRLEVGRSYGQIHFNKSIHVRFACEGEVSTNGFSHRTPLALDRCCLRYSPPERKSQRNPTDHLCDMHHLPPMHIAYISVFCNAPR